MGGTSEPATSGLSTVRMRSSLQQEAIDHIRAGRHISVYGAAGTGRSWLLHSIHSALERHGFDAVTLDAQNTTIQETLARAPAGQVALIDSFEWAGAPLVDTLTRFVDRGGQTVVSIETTSEHYPLKDLVEAQGGRQPQWEHTTHRIDLSPMSETEMLEYIHRTSAYPLHGALADAITQLAHGRPAWADILITLSQQGFVITFPYPSLLIESIPETLRGELQQLAQTSGALSDTQAAAAIALCEVTPLDFTGVGALVGQDTARALRESGVLIPLPNSAQLCVPQLLAVALRNQANPLDIETARSRIAHLLTNQELLGLPLNEQDTLFCARTLEMRAQSNSVNPEHDAHTSIMHRALAHLVTFGEVDRARSIMLRLVGLGVQLTGLNQVRTLLAFDNRRAAHLALQQTPPKDSKVHKLAHAYYAALLDSDDTGPTPSGERAYRIFTLAHSSNTFTTDVEPLADELQGTDNTELRDFVDAITGFEAVWLGAVPQRSWLTTGAPIPQPPLASDELLHDLLTATLLANALTAFLSGELQYRLNELLDSATQLPTPAYHRVWIDHLAGVSVAMLSGDAARALREWEMFEQRAPKLIPRAIRYRITVIGDAIRFSALSDDPHPSLTPEQSIMPYRLVCYLTGKYQVLVALPMPHTSGVTLPLLALGREHVDALKSQNPAELLRVGDRLKQHKIWTAATAAYTEARRIYLARRASGNVSKCDEKLESLAETATQAVPWLARDRLVAPATVRLTTREREAALLAAQGHTNRTIAEQLGCSIRTVESHIAQARAKLGAADRKELAAHLHLLSEQTPHSTASLKRVMPGRGSANRIRG